MTSAAATPAVSSTPPQFAAVIVCHNSEPDLARCLDALEAGTLRPAQIRIVDSGSDNTAYLEALPARPGLVCLRENNIGFGAGNNRGFAALPAEIPYVLFLNPDCFVRPDTLERAAALLEADTGLAAVGPRLLGVDRPSGVANGLLDSTGLVRRWYGRWQDRGQGEPDDARYMEPEDMPALCGACLFCRRSALEAAALGPGLVFDPAFFLYKEDIELSLPLRKRGFRLLYHPDLRALHCRGWQDRTVMPQHLKRVACANEIRLYLRHPSPYLLWALAKYLLVRLFGV